MANFNTGLTQTQLMNALNGGLNAVTSADLLAEQVARQHEDDIITDAVIEIITSSGQHNIIESGKQNGTGTRYANITQTFPVGQYTLYFGSITSNDTDAQTCQIGAFTSGNVAAATLVQCERGTDKTVILNITSEAAYIRVYASDTHAHGADDTITFQNAMLCKKVYYDLDPQYVAPRST